MESINCCLSPFSLSPAVHTVAINTCNSSTINGNIKKCKTIFSLEFASLEWELGIPFEHCWYLRGAKVFHREFQKHKTKQMLCVLCALIEMEMQWTRHVFDFHFFFSFQMMSTRYSPNNPTDNSPIGSLFHRCSFCCSFRTRDVYSIHVCMWWLSVEAHMCVWAYAKFAYTKHENKPWIWAPRSFCDQMYDFKLSVDFSWPILQGIFCGGDPPRGPFQGCLIVEIQFFSKN